MSFDSESEILFSVEKNLLLKIITSKTPIVTQESAILNMAGKK